MSYEVGDKVVFRTHKYSNSPGKRAINVVPQKRGENYHYDVDKLWKLKFITDESLVLVTRTGKTHTLDKGDHRLRKAYFWESWIYREKYNFSHLIEIKEEENGN
jgi:hypothetical protein